MRIDIEGSQARQLTGFDLNDELFVVENEPLESLLFDRNVIGGRFADLCLAATELFVAHVADEFEARDDLAELVILSKGLMYQVGPAFRGVVGNGLPMNLIATRRAEVTGPDAKIQTDYSRLEAPAASLIIGDTVASGATIVSALSAYQEFSTLNEVFLLSFAGSLPGYQRVSSYCLDNGIRLRVLYGLAAFGLASNGFDLSFLHPDTVTRSAYVERARLQFDGHPVSAVGWDFGSQSMAPQKYRELCWLEAEKWGLHGHPALALAEKPSGLGHLAAEAVAMES